MDVGVSGLLWEEGGRGPYAEGAAAIDDPVVRESQGDAVAGGDLREDGAGGDGLERELGGVGLEGADAVLVFVVAILILVLALFLDFGISAQRPLVVHPPRQDPIVVRQGHGVHTAHRELDDAYLRGGEEEVEARPPHVAHVAGAAEAELAGGALAEDEDVEPLRRGLVDNDLGLEGFSRPPAASLCWGPGVFIFDLAFGSLGIEIAPFRGRGWCGLGLCLCRGFYGGSCSCLCSSLRGRFFGYGFRSFAGIRDRSIGYECGSFGGNGMECSTFLLWGYFSLGCLEVSVELSSREVIFVGLSLHAVSIDTTTPAKGSSSAAFLSNSSRSLGLSRGVAVLRLQSCCFSSCGRSKELA